jgi:hypothetical protein
MPRKRRIARRTRRLELTEGERLWALGELTDDHPDVATVVFFTTPARLRAVWQAVHGEPMPAGAYWVHGARVGIRRDDT